MLVHSLKLIFLWLSRFVSCHHARHVEIISAARRLILLSEHGFALTYRWKWCGRSCFLSVGSLCRIWLCHPWRCLVLLCLNEFQVADSKTYRTCRRLLFLLFSYAYDFWEKRKWRTHMVDSSKKINKMLNFGCICEQSDCIFLTSRSLDGLPELELRFWDKTEGSNIADPFKWDGWSDVLCRFHCSQFVWRAEETLAALQPAVFVSSVYVLFIVVRHLVF